MKPLKDKIALVTGGRKNVGKGIAIALGEAGATVYEQTKNQCTKE